VRKAAFERLVAWLDDVASLKLAKLLQLFPDLKDLVVRAEVLFVAAKAESLAEIATLGQSVEASILPVRIAEGAGGEEASRSIGGVCNWRSDEKVGGVSAWGAGEKVGGVSAWGASGNIGGVSAGGNTGDTRAWRARESSGLRKAVGLGQGSFAPGWAAAPAAKSSVDWPAGACPFGAPENPGKQARTDPPKTSTPECSPKIDAHLAALSGILDAIADGEEDLLIIEHFVASVEAVISVAQAASSREGDWHAGVAWRARTERAHAFFYQELRRVGALLSVLPLTGAAWRVVRPRSQVNIIIAAICANDVPAMSAEIGETSLDILRVRPDEAPSLAAMPFRSAGSLNLLDIAAGVGAVEAYKCLIAFHGAQPCMVTLQAALAKGCCELIRHSWDSFVSGSLAHQLVESEMLELALIACTFHREEALRLLLANASSYVLQSVAEFALWARLPKSLFELCELGMQTSRFPLLGNRFVVLLSKQQLISGVQSYVSTCTRGYTRISGRANFGGNQEMSFVR
jgi:hypothetical protein